MTEPPEFPDVADITYDEFHPLGHPLWECGSWHAVRLHLAYGWRFKWPADLRRVLLCPLGGHRYMQWWRTGTDGQTVPGPVSCEACGRKA